MPVPRWTAWGLVLMVAAGAAGCASAPASPVADIKELAGQWAGDVGTRNGTHPYRVAIKEDGSAEVTVPSVPPGTFLVRYSLDKGAIRYESLTTGRTGSCTLRGTGDARTLSCYADDGGSRSESKPVK